MKYLWLLRQKQISVIRLKFCCCTHYNSQSVLVCAVCSVQLISNEIKSFRSSHSLFLSPGLCVFSIALTLLHVFLTPLATLPPIALLLPFEKAFSTSASVYVQVENFVPTFHLRVSGRGIGKERGRQIESVSVPAAV